MAVHCRCKESFSVLLNFRRHYRKQTNLSGTYKIAGEAESGGGIIQINNISSSGVGCTVSGLHRIEKDQEIRIEFQLNVKNKTVLKNLAVVTSVRQNAVGCEFKNNVEMDKALDFSSRVKLSYPHLFFSLFFQPVKRHPSKPVSLSGFPGRE